LIWKFLDSKVKHPLWREDGFVVCIAVSLWSESLRTHNHTLASTEVEVNLRPTVSWPVCLGFGLPSETPDQIFFSVWQLCVSWCGASSLTREWVCNLLVQLLLGFATAVTLGSKSRRTHEHILLSHMRHPQPRGSGPHIYIPPEQGDPIIPPGIGFPFRRLLRLAGLRWWYSNPPLHGCKYRISNTNVYKYIYCDTYYATVAKQTNMRAVTQ
jgi:hypothetical protein